MVNCQCNSCRATCQSRKWIFRVFVFQAIFVVGEPLCDLKPPFWVLNNFTRDNFMKIEWFITEVTAVGPPIRAQTDFFGHFWCFLAKLCCFCGQSATLWSGHPLLSPKDLMFGHFVKIELYITDVHNSYRVPHQSRAWFFLAIFDDFRPSSCRVPCKRWSDFFEWFWTLCHQFKTLPEPGEPLCHIEILSQSLKP